MLKRINRVAIVLNYVNYTDTLKMVNTLIHYKSVDHIVVVDNGSPNESFDKLRQNIDDNVNVIKIPKNIGYAKGNNLGVKHAIRQWGKQIIVFIINPDILVEDSVINEVAEYIEKNKDNGLGQVAPKLSGNSGEGAWKFTTIYKTLLFDGLFSPMLLPLKKKCFFYKPKKSQSQINVDVLLGAFFGIYGETFSKVNFFDENTFLYGEEQILALRLKKQKFQNVQLQNIVYDHVGGSSTSQGNRLFGFQQVSRSRRYIIRKYLGANKLELILFDLSYVISYAVRHFVIFISNVWHK